MTDKDRQIIIGVTGQIAAGKGTVAKYLKDKHDAVIYRFSTPLRDVLERMYLDDSRKNMQDISLDLRNRFGDDLLASITAKDVANDEGEIIMVDGVRRLPDIKYLRELPTFHLITITADQKIRWKRMTRRGENPDDKDKTFEEFKQDEQAEAEQQIAEVASTAEFTIDNNGTVEEAEQQMEEILSRIKNQ